MALFALVTLQPQGYVHVRAFDDIRILLFYSLSELGHDVLVATNSFPLGATSIVFGAHLIGPSLEADIPAGSIIVNTEQLSTHESDWSQRIFSLASRYQVWDYSSANIEQLKKLVDASNLHRLRLGYHSQLERVPNKRVDEEGFIFLGSITPQRETILSQIKLSQHLRLQAFFGLYGWHRDALLARCRAVVNIHSRPVRILEWPRILQLIANRVPCICLVATNTIAEDDQLSYVLSCDEANPTTGLERLFGSPAALDSHALDAYLRFRQNEAQGPYTAALLDESLSSGFLSAPSPLLRPAWAVADSQKDPDPVWYRHTYPWVDHDPRDPIDFHREEGIYRQYHPDPSFASCLRAPIAVKDKNSMPMAAQAKQKCAVVLHFYTDQSARQFFVRYGCHLAPFADFYVTTSSPFVAMDVRSLGLEYDVMDLDVRVIENVGRDIPSKYIFFNDAIQGYDLCFFSHGKESDHGWFHDHNAVLAGSTRRIQAILELFHRDESLGLVFPDYLPYLLPSVGWGTMRPIVDMLLEPFGCNTAPVKLLEFPAGGFFWARPSALGIMYSLELSLNDLPLEPIPRDNTLLHAIERMACISCEMMGFRWEKISRQSLAE